LGAMAKGILHALQRIAPAQRLHINLADFQFAYKQ